MDRKQSCMQTHTHANPRDKGAVPCCEDFGFFHLWGITLIYAGLMVSGFAVMYSIRNMHPYGAGSGTSRIMADSVPAVPRATGWQHVPWERLHPDMQRKKLLCLWYFNEWRRWSASCPRRWGLWSTLSSTRLVRASLSRFPAHARADGLRVWTCAPVLQSSSIMVTTPLSLLSRRTPSHWQVIKALGTCTPTSAIPSYAERPWG